MRDDRPPGAEGSSRTSGAADGQRRDSSSASEAPDAIDDGSLAGRPTERIRGVTLGTDERVSNLSARLKRYLRRFLGRAEDVDDIAQESFVRLLEAGSKGLIVHPSAYLYRTARNLAFNATARRSRHLERSLEEVFGPDVAAEAASIEDTVAAEFRFERFCQAAALLPPQCRKVLVLRKVYGLPPAEIAAQLGISVSTVEKHLAKALLRCAEYLEQQEQGSRDAPSGVRRQKSRSLP